MENPVKVLYFVDRMLRGGIQTFVLENLKHMDNSKVQIDFLLLDDGNTYELEEDLRKLGSNVYKLEGVWIRKLWDFVKYCKALDEFFKVHHDYKVVHLHSSSKNFMVLKKAKKYGIGVRIAHSHNIGFQSKNKLKIMLGDIFKKPLRKYASDYFACSQLAGEWLFGDEKVTVIHNAVDYEKFKFNEKRRNELRKELGLEGKFVVGNVGRFTNQKNHEFLIDIFDEIHKRNKNAVLVLVGTGEKEQKIKEKVQKLGLDKNVLFLGFQNNVNEYMWIMDCFVFPSVFEGLGLVLIEAQATGMKCFTSKDVVPEEAKVSELLEYVSLEKTAEEWAEVILNSNFERKDIRNELENKGYLIEQTAHQLESFYLGE